MRWLIILVTVLGALGLGTLVSRSPGYVLLSYEGVTLQTSLWFAFIVIFLGVVVFYVLLRSGDALWGVKNQISDWSSARRLKKAFKFLEKGIALMMLGEVERGRRYLEPASQNPAARDLAEVLLAGGGSPESAAMLDRLTSIGRPFEQLAAFYRAESALNAGLPDVALGLIKSLPDNLQTRRLKRRIWIANRAFEAMVDHQKQVSKFEDDLMLSDHQALLEARWNLASDNERKSWLSVLPSVSLSDDALLGEVLLSFDDPHAAEACCRGLIERAPTLGLFLAYGDLGSETSALRRRQLEQWQSRYPDSANVSAGFGALAGADGDSAAAESHYLECLGLKSSASIERRLVRNYLQAGRADAAIAMLDGRWVIGDVKGSGD